MKYANKYERVFELYVKPVVLGLAIGLVLLSMMMAGCGSQPTYRERQTSAKESLCDSRGISNRYDCKVILIR